VLSQVTHKQKCCESSIGTGQHADVTTLCELFRIASSCVHVLREPCSPSAQMEGLPPVQLGLLCWGPIDQLQGKHCVRCAHADLTALMLLKGKEEHLAHTVFVLQLVLLEGVAADGGYDIQSIQALSWLGLAHLTLRQGTYMFVALQQVS